MLYCYETLHFFCQVVYYTGVDRKMNVIMYRMFARFPWSRSMNRRNTISIKEGGDRDSSLAQNRYA